MKLSVIIISYNCKVYLDLCLQSVALALKNIDGEIIVFDNNSSDGTKDYIKSRNHKILFIDSDQNLGFSKANNIAAKSAKGDFLFFLNPDTIVPDNLFDLFLNNKKYKNMGILGFRMIDATGHFLKESKRNSPTISIVLKKIFGFKNNYHSDLDELGFGKVDVLCGANMLIEKKIFNKINCFNEDYFMYGEDIELSQKSLSFGYENYYDGRISLIHFKGESTKNDIGYLRNFYGAMQIYYNNIFSPSKLGLLSVKIFLRCIILVKSLSRKPELHKKNYKKTFLISDKLKDCLFNKYEDIILSKKFDFSVNDCRVILDLNYLNFNQIIEIINSKKSSHNINFCFLNNDYTYLIESAGMNKKGKVVFL